MSKRRLTRHILSNAEPPLIRSQKYLSCLDVMGKDRSGGSLLLKKTRSQQLKRAYKLVQAFLSFELVIQRWQIGHNPTSGARSFRIANIFDCKKYMKTTTQEFSLLL